MSSVSIGDVLQKLSSLNECTKSTLTISQSLLKTLLKELEANNKLLTESEFLDLIDCLIMYIDTCLAYLSSFSENEDVYNADNALSVVEYYMDLKDYHDQLVEFLMRPILERVIEPSCTIVQGYLLLKLLVHILLNSSMKMRRQFIKHNFMFCCKLADTLCTCGDYVYQTTILEAIFRLCDYEYIRQNNSIRKELFPENAHLQDAILKINSSSFDKDARTFLNTVNSLYNNVASINALHIMVDNYKLLPPKDFWCEGDVDSPIWIDFNKKSKRISFYFDAGSLNPYSEEATKAESEWHKFVVALRNIDKFSYRRQSIGADSLTKYYALNFDLKGILDTTALNLQTAKIMIIYIKSKQVAENLIRNVLPEILEEQCCGTEVFSSQDTLPNRKKQDNSNISGPKYQSLCVSYSEKQPAKSITSERKVIKRSFLLQSEWASECQTPNYSNYRQDRISYYNFELDREIPRSISCAPLHDQTLTPNKAPVKISFKSQNIILVEEDEEAEEAEADAQEEKEHEEMIQKDLHQTVGTDVISISSGDDIGADTGWSPASSIVIVPEKHKTERDTISRSISDDDSNIILKTLSSHDINQEKQNETVHYDDAQDLLKYSDEEQLNIFSLETVKYKSVTIDKETAVDKDEDGIENMNVDAINDTTIISQNRAKSSDNVSNRTVLTKTEITADKDLAVSYEITSATDVDVIEKVNVDVSNSPAIISQNTAQRYDGTNSHTVSPNKEIRVSPSKNAYLHIETCDENMAKDQTKFKTFLIGTEVHKDLVINNDSVSTENKTTITINMDVSNNFTSVSGKLVENIEKGSDETSSDPVSTNKDINICLDKIASEYKVVDHDQTTKEQLELNTKTKNKRRAKAIYKKIPVISKELVINVTRLSQNTLRDLLERDRKEAMESSKNSEEDDDYFNQSVESLVINSTPEPEFIPASNENVNKPSDEPKFTILKNVLLSSETAHPPKTSPIKIDNGRQQLETAKSSEFVSLGNLSDAERRHEIITTVALVHASADENHNTVSKAEHINASGMAVDKKVETSNECMPLRSVASVVENRLLDEITKITDDIEDDGNCPKPVTKRRRLFDFEEFGNFNPNSNSDNSDENNQILESNIVYQSTNLTAKKRGRTMKSNDPKGKANIPKTTNFAKKARKRSNEESYADCSIRKPRFNTTRSCNSTICSNNLMSKIQNFSGNFNSFLHEPHQILQTKSIEIEPPNQYNFKKPPIVNKSKVQPASTAVRADADLDDLHEPKQPRVFGNESKNVDTFFPTDYNNNAGNQNKENQILASIYVAFLKGATEAVEKGIANRLHTDESIAKLRTCLQNVSKMYENLQKCLLEDK